ncbi:PPOX class F420-dependent oxidoreductase [Herbidospora galbida]|uniref:PPOX class F420-dependent oxidoreductase n=1 Tax=Herbidospora galbida TaxID=2575442 RepID=A0A4U3MR99_9ACTN|nr:MULTISPECIES: PPOX class F420-dependent oxidoreductase [Herbidospora]TKK90897.1 PPOX class F420-dependent oxidoreductase [Herbidospora galbida]
MGEQTLPDGVRSLFDGANFATVSSVNPDGSPQASVVWVRTDGDAILFSTVKGRRKHRNMERDPRVSILIVDPADPYVYAEVRGSVTLFDDPHGDLIQELSHKYAGKPFVEGSPDNERVIVRIAPEKVYLRG